MTNPEILACAQRILTDSTALVAALTPPPPKLWRIVLEVTPATTYVAAAGESLPDVVRPNPASGYGTISVEATAAEKPAPITIIREDYDANAQPPTWTSSEAYPVEFVEVTE